MHIIPTEGMAVHAGGFLCQTVRKICQGYLTELCTVRMILWAAEGNVAYSGCTFVCAVAI